jgi:hypothetical protein
VSTLIPRIPVVLFLIFAAYWSAWDLHFRLWVALLPSLLIGGLLLLRRRA